MCNRLLVLTACVIICFWAGAAPDLSTPQTAAHSLYKAVDAQDGPAILACFYAQNLSETELARTFADMIVASKQLNDASKLKFGGNGDALGAGMMSKEEQARIDTADVKVTGDNATLSNAGQPKPMRFHRTAGQWQLVIADYAGATPENLPSQIQLLKSVTKVLGDMAREVAEGKYPAADDAEQAIQQKLALVMIKAAQKPTTRPSTNTGK